MAASGNPYGALSPARVRAMPERFVVIERPQKAVLQEEDVALPSIVPCSRCWRTATAFS